MLTPYFINKIKFDWALFLDRDGVINKRIYGGYVTRIDEFEFLPGVLETLCELSSVFSKIFIITNQQGIGKNLMKESDLELVHEHMLKLIRKSGGRIDAIYHCPDLAHKSDNCRKPNPYMALKAKSDFPEIDLKKSIMIGDSYGDIQFAKNVDMKAVYIRSEHADKNATELADLTISDLKEFLKLIKRNEA